MPIRADFRQFLEILTQQNILYVDVQIVNVDKKQNTN